MSIGQWMSGAEPWSAQTAGAGHSKNWITCTGFGINWRLPQITDYTCKARAINDNFWCSQYLDHLYSSEEFKSRSDGMRRDEVMIGTDGHWFLQIQIQNNAQVHKYKNTTSLVPQIRWHSSLMTWLSMPGGGREVAAPPMDRRVNEWYCMVLHDHRNRKWMIGGHLNYP